MPMGATNAHAAFVAMVNNFEIQWNQLYTKRSKLQQEAKWTWLQTQLDAEPPEATAWNPTWTKPTHTDPQPGSAVIVDDIILFANTAAAQFYYFICVVEILQHHRTTVKLRKTRFFPSRAEFVGVDVTPTGNTPAESKYAAIRELEKPILYTDLRMLIGFIGFYRNWIPLYESRIGPWRDHMKTAPAPGTTTKEEEAAILQELWLSLIHI